MLQRGHRPLLNELVYFLFAQASLKYRQNSEKLIMNKKIKLAIFTLILMLTANFSFAQTPRTATDWYNLGNKQLSQKNYQQAIDSYTKSLELIPDYYRARINRGIAYYQLEKYDLAIQDYDRVLKFKPFHSNTFYSRGLAFQKKNEHSKAIADFTYAITFNSKNPDGYFARSISYCQTGQIEPARKDETQTIKYGGKVTNPCKSEDDKRIYPVNDASWKKINLDGTGLSIMSPREFKLLQSKPSEVGQNQLAYVFYATDFNDIDAVVTYEKRADRQTVLEKMNFSKKLFDERYQDAESEVFASNFGGGTGVRFIGKYTDPKTGRKMSVDQKMFGSNGEYYSLRIAYPRDDTAVANIVNRMLFSFGTENNVAKTASGEPSANWKSLQFNGLNFQTPTTQTDPDCKTRYSKNKTPYAQTFYCFKWNKTLLFDVGYGNFINRKTPTPAAAAVMRKAAEISFNNTYDPGSTNNYSTTNININGADEAVKLKITEDYGSVSRVTEIIYIKRGMKIWEISVSYAGEDQFDIAVKDRIINSISIR
jgi:tetratricopeptide (TPR) repeat protein